MTSNAKLRKPHRPLRKRSIEVLESRQLLAARLLESIDIPAADSRQALVRVDNQADSFNATTGEALRTTAVGSLADVAVPPELLRSTTIPAPIPTSQWVVTLESGAAEIGEVTSALGISNDAVTATDLIPHTFIVDTATSTYFAAGGVNEQLATVSTIVSSYQLIDRQHSRRLIPNDPMFDQQWHLRNTGQSGGTPGEDANVTDVWDNYTGDGVTIAVVDDGIQHSHPDLSTNYIPAASFDFNGNDSNPDAGASSWHGTSVGGVAAATFNNQEGVSGVAPGASLSGLRLIDGPVNDATEANALTYALDINDVYNNSWGPFDDAQRLEGPGPLTLAAFENGTTNGRNGLGVIYVWAAGNGLGSNDNTNYDGYANSRYTIAVTALDHNGNQPGYAEPGAPILVGAHSDPAGITTTDVGSGYTNNFGGTSSATPLASGVIALMLDANPNLTWRDVQHVLVHSAAQNDPNDNDWTTNGAGHLINHKYGFGAVDAEAAVNAALNWTTVPDEVVYESPTRQINQAIPDNSQNGVSDTITVPESVTIETVEVVLDAQHNSRGHLEVILTSPSGTESILAEPHADTGNNYNNWSFTSVRHWDEDSQGDWTISVRDRTNGTTGNFQSWSLNIYGTPGNQDVGSVEFDQASYLSGDPVQITVRDNVDAPSVSVVVTTDSGDSETVTLNAQGDNVFQATLPTAIAPPNGGNGRLDVDTQDTLTVTYQDADDGQGNSPTVTDTADILSDSTAEIRGELFDDVNRNRVQDSGEPPLVGWTVFLDLNDNGFHDPDEPQQLTGANGGYAFTGLSSGNYTVLAIAMPDWAQTSPFTTGDNAVNDGGFELGTPNGAWAEQSAVFGSTICSDAICGSNGANNGDYWVWFGGAGNQAETASVTQQVTIPFGANVLEFQLQIPAASNQGGADTMTVSLDGNQLFQVTNQDDDDWQDYGQVSLDISAFADGGTHTLVFAASMDSNTNFFVDDVLIPASPTPISHNVDLALGEVATDLNYGFAEGAPPTTGSVSGTIFNDANADGSQNGNENGVPGVTVYVDLNQNGSLDNNEPQTTTAADGTYLFPELPPGNHVVRPTVPNDWTQTSPVGVGGNLITDGGFEAGTPNPNWDEDSQNWGTPICWPANCSTIPGSGPLTGDAYVWFGGLEDNESAFVSQSVVIDPAATTLDFMLEIPDASGNGTDTMTVSIDGDVLFTVNESNAASWSVYAPVSLDITQYADGGSHELRIESTTSGPSSFLVDDVAINTPGGPIQHNVAVGVGSNTTDIDYGFTLPNLTPMQVIEVAHNVDRVDPPDLPGEGAQQTDWATQQSLIANIEVTFDTPIASPAAGFVLTSLGVNADADPDQVVNIPADQISVDGNTVLIDLAGVDIPDGVLQLEVLPSVTGSQGEVLDGNGDGTPGDSYVLVGSAENRFYKLNSDWNGDRGVSIFDYVNFAYWFGASMPTLPQYMDNNGDGSLSIFDFPAFAERFGVSLSFPAAARDLAAEVAPADPQGNDEESRPIERELIAALPSTDLPSRLSPTKVDRVLERHTPAAVEVELDWAGDLLERLVMDDLG